MTATTAEVLAFLDRCIASPARICTMLSSAQLCRQYAANAAQGEAFRYWALRCVAYTHGIASSEHAQLQRNLVD